MTKEELNTNEAEPIVPTDEELEALEPAVVEVQDEVEEE